MQINSEWAVYLWVFSILIILYFINIKNKYTYISVEDVNKYMKEVSKKWVKWEIKIFNELELFSVANIYNKYKKSVIDFWIIEWYISKSEWNRIINYLNDKVSWKFDVKDSNSLEKYIEISKL